MKSNKRNLIKNNIEYYINFIRRNLFITQLITQIKFVRHKKISVLRFIRLQMDKY